VSVVTEEGTSRRVGTERATDNSAERAGGPESVFELIFLNNYARVVAVLFRLVGDRAQAEELASDVFWKLYQQPLPPGREHNLGGWLYRTATHLGIDALRAAARRRRYEQDAGLQVLEADAALDPLDTVLRDEKRRRVRATLARLKPTHAQLLILRSSGFSYQELAQTLEVKASSVGTLLARAEAEFERRYRELHGEEEEL
jgi:RNA polymerase sigma-70 factor (ECF subfamily)